MFKSEEELLSMTALMKLFSVPESEKPLPNPVKGFDQVSKDFEGPRLV